MNYERAKGIIDEHGERVRNGTGVVRKHNPTAKRLKNQTWLHYDKDGHYTLSYFNKNIIEYHLKYVVLNDHSFFSTSTMQRFNEFMPKGFHMSGCTYSAFKLKRPLGFITTPAGTFPYTMPCTYTYEGGALDYGGLCSDVRNILLKIPQYVDKYLDELFGGKPCFLDDELSARRSFERTFIVGGNSEESKHRISRSIGASIEQASTYKYFAVLAAENVTKTIAGMDVGHAIDLMIQYGSELFATQSKSGRMEAALLAGKVPTINRQQLRKAIRQLYIEHLVDLLGFDEVQWNRR